MSERSTWFPKQHIDVILSIWSKQIWFSLMNHMRAKVFPYYYIPRWSYMESVKRSYKIITYQMLCQSHLWFCLKSASLPCNFQMHHIWTIRVKLEKEEMYLFGSFNHLLVHINNFNVKFGSWHHVFACHFNFIITIWNLKFKKRK